MAPERQRVTGGGRVRARTAAALLCAAAVAVVLAACGGGGGSSTSTSGGGSSSAVKGADKTKITSWTDPRPASWSQSYAPFAPVKTGDGSLARAQSNGLTVCTNNQVAPFTFADPKTGKIKGFEVDMLGWMAKRLGISNVKYVNIEWQSLIPALSANKCDMVMAGMAVRTARANAPGVQFTTPYFLLFDQVTVLRGSPISNVRQLAGKKVASVVGSTDADNLDLFLKSNGIKANVVKFNGYNECFQAVAAKLADACWLDEGTTQGALRMYKQLKAIGKPFVYQPTGAFKSEAKSIPYVFGSVAMLTQKKDGDLNRALSIADVDLVKTGEQKRILEPIGLWSEKQAQLVRPDTGWKGPLTAPAGSPAS